MSIKEKVLKEKDYREIEKMKETIILAKKEILDLRSEAIDLVNKGIIIGRNEALEEKKKQVEWLKEEVDNMPLAIEDDVIPDVVVKWFLKKIDEAFPDLKESFTKEKNVFKN